MKIETLWAFKLSVTILILTYIVTNIPISSIFTAFESLEVVTIFLIVPVILLSTIISALQLKVFTDNPHMYVSFSRMFGINFSTEFYNLFLPSYLADSAIRWHKLSKDNKKSTEALAAIIPNRTVLLSNFRLVPASLLRGLSKLLYAAIEYQKLSLRKHSVIFMLSCFWQILGGMFLVLLARSIDFEIHFERLGWIRSILGLLLLFPVSISEFSVREGGLTFLFAYVGIATAMAFSFLIFTRTLLLGPIGALLEVKETRVMVEHGASY